MDCHGATGKGDGSKSPFLSPRPGNLISAATSAKTDKELLRIIAQGKSRTAMPAWQDVLPADDQQAVLQYIRSLIRFTRQPASARSNPLNMPLPRHLFRLKRVTWYSGILLLLPEVVRMIRGNLFHRRQTIAIITFACSLVIWNGSADSALAAGGKTHSATAPPKRTPAVQTALRYAEAVAHGDRVTAGQLDFACQYRFITGSPTKVKQFAPAGDPSYESCWHTLTEAHAPMLKRTDTVMDVIWPSTGPLVFFGDDLPRAPASAFVMDVLGVSPPGSGLQATVINSRTIPAGSFRLTSKGKVLGVPTTLVQISVQYHDPLTSPVTYAAGNVKWTNTIKRPRKSLKSVTTQWVVFTGLKQYGFPGDAAVFNLPVASDPEAPGMVAEKIPFATESSRALP